MKLNKLKRLFTRAFSQSFDENAPVVKKPTRFQRLQSRLNDLKRFKQSAMTLAAVLCVLSIGVMFRQFNQGLAIEAIELIGDMDVNKQDAVRSIVYEHVKGKGFFTLSLKETVNDVRQLGWVEDVRIRKNWPHQVHVEVVAHKPVARLNLDKYISATGDVFAREYSENATQAFGLPQIVAPEKSTEMVVQFYAYAAKKFAPYNIKITAFELMANGSWKISLDTVTDIRLNAENAQRDLSDFVGIMEKYFLERMINIAHIDLRYQQGFSIQWKAQLANEISRNTVGERV